MNLKLVIEPSAAGGYTAHVPALRGCVSEGGTSAQARENVREAIALYLEDDGAVDAPPGAIVEDVVV